jgi:hypothetical protein
MIEINMRMPEKCGFCPCFHYNNPIYCQAVKADKNKKIVNPYGAPRPEWCPLKEQDPVKAEIEGGGHTWWYVCPECHGSIDSKDHFCRHCGQAVKWE